MSSNYKGVSEREIFGTSNVTKIGEVNDYYYYVNKDQEFINGYAAAEVYVVSKVTKYLEAVRYCVINDNYKEAFSEPANLLTTKSEDYLKISRNNKGIIRIGNNDFCVTRMFNLEDGSSNNSVLNIHIRLVEGKVEIANENNLGDIVTLTQVPGIALLHRTDESGTCKECLYDVENAKVLTDEFSNIGEFRIKNKGWFAVVTDIYSVEDVSDEAMFTIDETGRITSLIYFVSDDGNISKAVDSSNEGFNYAKFKELKVSTMLKKEEMRHNKIYELLSK